MLQALIGPVTGLLDKFIEDKDQKNALAHKLATMADEHAQELAKGQLAVNAIEAAHKSLFVAGWRPFVGWICGVGLLYNVIISQILGIWFEVPTVDPSLLTPVLMGMLGMGAIGGGIAAFTLGILAAEGFSSLGALIGLDGSSLNKLLTNVFGRKFSPLLVK